MALDQWPSFVNKFYWNSHAHLFTYCLWMLCAQSNNSKVNFLWQETSGQQSLKYLLSGPLRKRLQILPQKRDSAESETALWGEEICTLQAIHLMMNWKRRDWRWGLGQKAIKEFQVRDDESLRWSSGGKAGQKELDLRNTYVVTWKDWLHRTEGGADKLKNSTLRHVCRENVHKQVL